MLRANVRITRNLVTLISDHLILGSLLPLWGCHFVSPLSGQGCPSRLLDKGPSKFTPKPYVKFRGGCFRISSNQFTYILSCCLHWVSYLRNSQGKEIYAWSLDSRRGRRGWGSRHPHPTLRLWILQD